MYEGLIISLLFGLLFGIFIFLIVPRTKIPKKSNLPAYGMIIGGLIGLYTLVMYVRLNSLPILFSSSSLFFVWPALLVLVLIGGISARNWKQRQRISLGLFFGLWTASVLIGVLGFDAANALSKNWEFIILILSNPAGLGNLLGWTLILFFGITLGGGLVIVVIGGILIKIVTNKDKDIRNTNFTLIFLQFLTLLGLSVMYLDNILDFLPRW